jgi:hypothetical protein
MAATEQEKFEFVSRVGFEAFQLMQQRIEALGPLAFTERFMTMVSVSVVCLANVLRPGVERAPSRGSAADALISTTMKQVRQLLEPVVRGEQ